MSNYKLYFKYIGEFNKKMLMILPLILISNTVSSVWSSIKMAPNYEDAIIFTSQSISISIVVAILLGICYSTSFFSHAMSIKADRVGFIKAALIWALILSVGLGVAGFILDIGCKSFIQSYTGKAVEIYSPINWINDGTYEFGTTIISRIFNNLILFSIFFMIGSIWYRLKVKYSLLLFVVLPICSVTYLVNYVFRNPAKVEEFGLKILNIFEYLMINQNVSNSFKLIGTVVFTLFAIRLLIKAPIKDYSNDLI